MSMNNTYRVFVVYGAICVIVCIIFQYREKTASVEKTVSVDSLFSDSSKIRQCTAGKVIGIRPSVTTVSIKEVAYGPNTKLEENQERKTSFTVIFRNRIWLSDKTVNFSASGKTITFT